MVADIERHSCEAGHVSEDTAIANRSAAGLGGGTGTAAPTVAARRPTAPPRAVRSIHVVVQWADPFVALVIAAVAVKEGREAWRGDHCW